MSSRPRGRPSAGSDPVLPRSDLLEAAALAFSTGYPSMSVRGLARDLGVSQATIQYHAPTKEALLFAVIDELVVPRLEATTARAAILEGGLPPPGGREAVLRDLVRDRVHALARHGGVVTAVLSDRSRGADDRRAYLARALSPQRAAALGTLRSLAESGLTRPVSTAAWTALTMVLVPSLARAWSLLELADPHLALDPDAVIDEVADILMLGLLARR